MATTRYVLRIIPIPFTIATQKREQQFRVPTPVCLDRHPLPLLHIPATRHLKPMSANRHLIALGIIAVLHAGTFWALRAGWVTEVAPQVEKTMIARLLLAQMPAPVQAAPRAPAPQAAVAPRPPRATPAARPLVQKPVAVSPAPTAITLPDTPPPRDEVGPAAPAPTPVSIASVALPAAPPSASPAPAPAPAPEAARVAAPAPQIKTVTSGVQYLKPPEPVYPVVSRRLGEQGRVILRVLVGLAGEPERVEVLQSSGFPKLDGAAREAARHSRFRPYVDDGKATPVWALIPIHFALES